MFKTFGNIFRKKTQFEIELANSTILNNAETVNINDIKNLLLGLYNFNLHLGFQNEKT